MTVEFKGYTLVVSGDLRACTGCGDASITYPRVEGAPKPGSMDPVEVPREILVEFLSHHFIPYLRNMSLTNTEGCSPVYFLNRAQSAGSNVYGVQKTHDLILSGDCGTVVQCPAIANRAHGEIVYDSVLLPYIWVPKCFEKSFMQGPLYKEEDLYKITPEFAKRATVAKKNLKQTLTKAGYL